MDDLKIAQAIERDLQKEELKGLSDAIGKEGIKATTWVVNKMLKPSFLL